jgi:hypothetical protein
LPAAAVLLGIAQGELLAVLGGAADVQRHVQLAGTGGRGEGAEADLAVGRCDQLAAVVEGDRVGARWLAIDVIAHGPFVGVGALDEVRDLDVAHAQRVVHGDATAGVVVAVRIGRVEGRHRRLLGVGRQGEANLHFAGLLRRAVGGQQLQVDQAACIEVGAIGIRREHLQARTCG